MGELLAEFSWRRDGSGHVYTRVGKRKVYLHRLIVGLTHGDKLQVDHLNENKLDNRAANLEVTKPAPHARKHMRKAWKTGKLSGDDIKRGWETRRAKGLTASTVRGVSFDKQRNRWRAYGYTGSKRKYLGGFLTEAEAIEATRRFYGKAKR